MGGGRAGNDRSAVEISAASYLCAASGAGRKSRSRRADDPWICRSGIGYMGGVRFSDRKKSADL